MERWLRKNNLVLTDRGHKVAEFAVGFGIGIGFWVMFVVTGH
jgi:hypothetical protein